MSKNPKTWWKLMTIANIDREILHNFWTTWEILIKFSRKMCLMIILKVTKPGFHPLEDTFSEKPQGESNWPPALSRFRVKDIEEALYRWSNDTIIIMSNGVFKWVFVSYDSFFETNILSTSMSSILNSFLFL